MAKPRFTMTAKRSRSSTSLSIFTFALRGPPWECTTSTPFQSAGFAIQ
jgi:hypothetical protein